jgi:single-stranded DNA-binding protein
MLTSELNELTISGYVEHKPTLHGPGGESCCELVLTHSIYSQRDGGWLLAFFTVRIWGQLGEQIADAWQPRQTIVITGHLDYELHDTLAGPMPKVTILATHVLVTGLRQGDEPTGYELQHSPAGPIWRTPDSADG